MANVVSIQTKVTISDGVVVEDRERPLPKVKAPGSLSKWGKASRVVSLFVCLLLCLGFMLLAVGIVAYSPGFYAAQFAKGNTAERMGMSDEDLLRFSDGLIDYFSGETDTLQIQVSFNGDEPVDFYSEDELTHMKDAKVIFVAVRTLGWIFYALGLAAMIALVIACKDRKQVVAFGTIWGSFIFLTLSAILGIIAAANFQAAFVVFHNIFFPQGNWQFDTPMVQILTSDLFMDATVYILIWGFSFAVVMFVAGILLKFVRRRRRAGKVGVRQVAGWGGGVPAQRMPPPPPVQSVPRPVYRPHGQQ